MSLQFAPHPLFDTAYVSIDFQAAERLTWIVHDASDTLTSATGRETVQTLGRAPENVYCGTGFTLGYSYISTMQAQPGNETPLRS